ncbi:MAG: sulfatase [Flavobacterium sp. BFFFF2]|nr:MAG: sulfatase [Flavobacterium sp. BFFFF2]
MKKSLRINEYKALAYRLALAFLFYGLARLLFVLYNLKLVKVHSLGEWMSLQYHGLTFDTTAILYVNSLFIVFSLFPTGRNSKAGYQKRLKILYFLTNLIAYATNFIDFIYYRFNFGRSTRASVDVLENESNKSALFFNFLLHYWHVFLLFILLSWCWVYLYKKVTVKEQPIGNPWLYGVFSLVGFCLVTVLSIGGIRGDFEKSTRPINLLDASRFVKEPAHADVILNTPFALIRTWDANDFQKFDFMPQKEVDALIHPIKKYAYNKPEKPNIVLFILESYGREYSGAFNKGTTIPDFKSYTPFIDSLANHSLIFTNGYANGHKSIHGMSSILAGIPSFREAFTSSPYPKQKIESLVSTLKGMGYDTSFFHGAPNGSMGFLGFGNILGFDHYYGKTEYNNDADFDGVWGIWDEPFFQYMKRTLDGKKQPFMSTLFSVTSHEPYQIPEKYQGKFPKGTVNIHQCVGYTDYALKRFFQEARKQAWYQNTIFVMVADHSNTIAYDEYRKEFNLNTVPILFFSPNHKWVGSSAQLAQQIDIYPTILDMIGYQKPFRSWGRSLVHETDVQPFVIKYSSNQYVFMYDNYICCFDGQQVTGLYHASDRAMKNNCIKQAGSELPKIEKLLKAYLQDYMHRVIDKKLGSEQ